MDAFMDSISGSSQSIILSLLKITKYAQQHRNNFHLLVCIFVVLGDLKIFQWEGGTR